MARQFFSINRWLRWSSQFGCFAFARIGIFRKLPGDLHWNVPRSELIFPFFNCQGCELAWAGCPIGMFQVYLIQRRFPFYLIGMTLLSAAVLARFVCGWLCPFGFFLDVLGKFSKGDWRGKVPDWFKYTQYVNLVGAGVLAILTADIFFSKYICFTGIIFGVTMYWFTWNHLTLFWLVYHLIQLMFFIFATYKIGGRFWCFALCPYGALLSLFNRVSIFKLRWHQPSCTQCGNCVAVCPMECDPKGLPKRIDQLNCMRCGECVNVCPHNCLSIQADIPDLPENPFARRTRT